MQNLFGISNKPNMLIYTEEVQITQILHKKVHIADIIAIYFLKKCKLFL